MSSTEITDLNLISAIKKSVPIPVLSRLIEQQCNNEEYLNEERGISFEHLSVMRDVCNEIEEIGGIDDEESEDEETEPYCFKDTTIDTVNTDICFCSVGGCVKPTEFD